MKRSQRMLAVAEIKPNPRNPRTHSKRQIQQIADSINQFGFTVPVLVDESRVLLAGMDGLRRQRR